MAAALHKLTPDVADRHAVITLGDQRIQNMTASAEGASLRLAATSRAKVGLNRSILAAAWGEFRRLIDYKVPWWGGRVMLVDPRHPLLHSNTQVVETYQVF